MEPISIVFLVGGAGLARLIALGVKELLKGRASRISIQGPGVYKAVEAGGDLNSSIRDVLEEVQRNPVAARHGG